MDTVTQALLGGAIGFVVAGHKAPRKAILVGASIAILPDLDVFISQANDLADMTRHRSWSHSWLVQTAIAPLLAWVISQFERQISFKSWWLVVWLALVTHSALDALTIYGTQLFWPFMPSPISIGSIFIIDPLYSLPLLLGFIWILVNPLSATAKHVFTGGFLFSCVYLLWGLSAQYWIYQQTVFALNKQKIDYINIKIGAAPLNTLLWRVLVIDEERYYETYRSVFDGQTPWYFTAHSLGEQQILARNNLAAVDELHWFTNGFYKVEAQGNDLIATDLRMGMEPDYFFQFKVAEKQSEKWTAIPPQQTYTPRNAKSALIWVWRRIWFNQDT